MSGYTVVVYCSDCSFGQDPKGCFDGGTNPLPDEYGTLDEAKNVGWDEIAYAGPYGFRVLADDEIVFDSECAVP